MSGVGGRGTYGSQQQRLQRRDDALGGRCQSGGGGGRGTYGSQQQRLQRRDDALGGRCQSGGGGGEGTYGSQQQRLQRRDDALDHIWKSGRRQLALLSTVGGHLLTDRRQVSCHHGGTGAGQREGQAKVSV